MNDTIEFVDTVYTPGPLESTIEECEEREEFEVQAINERVYFAGLSQQLFGRGSNYDEDYAY